MIDDEYDWFQWFVDWIHESDLCVGCTCIWLERKLSRQRLAPRTVYLVTRGCVGKPGPHCVAK